MTVAITTPEGINAYRLASIRAALRLESVGMKTRGGALRPKIAKELGLRPRDSYATFIKELDTRIAASKFGDTAEVSKELP